MKYKHLANISIKNFLKQYSYSLSKFVIGHNITFFSLENSEFQIKTDKSSMIGIDV